VWSAREHVIDEEDGQGNPSADPSKLMVTCIQTGEAAAAAGTGRLNRNHTPDSGDNSGLRSVGGGDGLG